MESRRAADTRGSRQRRRPARGKFRRGCRLPRRRENCRAECRGVHGHEPRRHGERARGRARWRCRAAALRLLARSGGSHDPRSSDRRESSARPGHRLRAVQARRRSPRPRDAAVPALDHRPAAVVYGEWDRGTLKIFQLARRGVVPVFGDGSQELSVIHAEDLARALIAAATSPASAGRVYFAAHPVITTSRALVLAAARALGRGAPRIVPVPPVIARGVLWAVGTLAYLAGRATLLSADKSNEYLAPAWTCRSEALTRDTNWQAQIDLETGLRRAANWYREVGWL